METQSIIFTVKTIKYTLVFHDFTGKIYQIIKARSSALPVFNFGGDILHPDEIQIQYSSILSFSAFDG
jgi:hypothetical protein